MLGHARAGRGDQQRRQRTDVEGAGTVAAGTDDVHHVTTCIDVRSRGAHDFGEAGDFASPSGKGAIGTVDGRRVALGNAMLMGELNIATRDLDGAAEAARQNGATAIYVAVDGRAAGMIAIADPIKPSAQAALQKLREDGLRVEQDRAGPGWSRKRACRP